ncbi:hypothetical protein BVG16_16935 [Paenibacillus selenitireducens]|jgi:hypothetical protein|uniref:Uncharacterized protein n=1 Tax=Paenibacillus selenitireducens TaxID=1324314 RepID=A0A1T2XAH9_9BACL|nr:hypothetical protein [Paenibacillus selenitireducens]OPA76840.1 hypothetical protein BVG16_16935 [Paenibacillus selenitireducens]
MVTDVKSSQGNEKVLVELTVNEAMALTGIRFNENREVAASARRKLNTAIERQYDIAIEH